MKQILLPCALLLCGSVFAQNPLLEEDFESYTVGSYIGESSAVWTTWSGTTGTDEDGIISNDYSLSGTNSLNIFGAATTGGPMDVYLPIGLDNPYELSFSVYVPSGNSAYFNIQEDLVVLVGWAFDVVLDSQGNVSLGIDQVDLAQTTYTPDSWTLFNLYMDPVNDRAEIHVNNECLINVPFDAQIGGLNLFGFGDGVTPGNYYVDDLIIIDCPSINTVECSTGELVSEMTGLDLDFGPNPATDYLQLSSNTSEGILRIMALNGQIVAEHYLINLEAGSRINLDLDNGIYLVELRTNENSTMRKLVVNR